MRGVGESHGAITIVNALPTGIGAAAGIALSARAEVRIDPTAGPGGPTVSIRPAASDTPLVRATLLAAVERLSLSGPHSVELEVHSHIPPGTGLKSSSAVGCAVVRAVDAAAGEAGGAEAVARLSAEVSRRVGASATGAFDDALAGLSSGVVVTDNRHDRLLRSHPLPPGHAVALWIPPGVHVASPEAARRFAKDEPRARRAAEAAIAGRLWEAMDENSEVVEEAMGYDYRDLRARVRRHGAVGAGTSGLGPAFAAVAPLDRMEEVLAELPRSSGTRRTVPFLAPAPSHGGR